MASVPSGPLPRIQVLQIIGNAIVGGMEACVLRLVERLPRERFSLTAMCPFESPYTEQLRAQGAEVLVASMPPDAPPWSSIQLAATLMRSRSIDVVHAHLGNAHLLAALAGRLASCPVLATVHGRELSPLDLELHRSAGTHLGVVCKHSWFHALGLGVNPAQLHLMPNGVDTTVFRPARLRDGPLRQRFGIPAEAPLAGFVGRLSWEKGPDVFLRAVLGARHAAPHAHFMLVGDGPMLRELHGTIEQFGLGGCTHLAGLQTDMPAVYGEFDLLVSTSHSEAMPLAMMEAMACGLPVVATRVGGVPDLILHGSTGWLVGPNDFQAVGAKLGQLLNAPAELAAMGEQARRRAVAHFSLDESVQSTAQLLTRLAGLPAETPARISAVASESKPAAARSSGKAAGA